LKKQSQCQNGQNNAKLVITRVYGYYGEIKRFRALKTKPIFEGKKGRLMKKTGEKE